MHTWRHDIYKAKAARRPARPAPPMRAEMELAAPVAEGEAVPEPEPVWFAEPEPEPERDAPEAVGLAAPEPVPEAAGEAAAPGIRVPVCDEGKSLAMQLCTQSEYF